MPSTTGTGGPAAARYARPLQALHWSIAGLVALQFALVPVFKQLEAVAYASTLLSFHRQCGMLIALMVAVRLGLGLFIRPPGSNRNWPAWQILTARAVHVLLIVILLMQPLAGMLLAWARGDDIIFAGVLKFPRLIEVAAEHNHILKQIHSAISYGLLAGIAVHVGAVFFNKYVRRTSVLERMLSESPANRLTNRIPLAAQLAFCCGTTLALCTAAGLYGARQYKVFSDYRQSFDETEVTALDDLRSAQLDLRTLAARSPAESADIALVTKVAAEIAGLGKELTNVDARAKADAARQALQRLPGRSPAVAITEADQSLQAAADAQYNAVIMGRLAIGEIAAKGHDTIVLALAPTAMIGIVLTCLLARSVLSALSRARTVVRGVEAGVSNDRVKVQGSGEFAELMRDILKMRSTVETRHREAAEQQGAQQARIAELASKQQHRETEILGERAAEQAQIVESLANGLAALARGDLRHRIEQPFSGDYDQIRTNFNETMAQLEAAICSIAETSGSITINSGVVADAIGDLSHRTELQAARLEDILRAVGDVSNGVTSSAQDVRQAADFANAARKQATHTTQVVSEAMAAMAAIESSVQQVEQIIGMIDAIALQTNLLAVNASIEAAHAGASGRGFAIIAAEVRSLAARSAGSAKKIKSLISTSTTLVDSGVQMVAKTGDALQIILGRIGDIDTIMANTASSVRSQAANLGEVQQSIDQIDQVVQQNAAMVEETTATAQGLASDTDTLDRLIRHFKTGTDGADMHQDSAVSSQRYGRAPLAAQV